MRSCSLIRSSHALLHNPHLRYCLALGRASWTLLSPLLSLVRTSSISNRWKDGRVCRWKRWWHSRSVWRCSLRWLRDQLVSVSVCAMACSCLRGRANLVLSFAVLEAPFDIGKKRDGGRKDIFWLSLTERVSSRVSLRSCCNFCPYVCVCVLALSFWCLITVQGLLSLWRWRSGQEDRARRVRHGIRGATCPFRRYDTSVHVCGDLICLMIVLRAAMLHINIFTIGSLK